MKYILFKICSDKKDITSFLSNLDAILDSDDFNIRKNLYLANTTKNQSLQLDRNYDLSDILEILRTLTIDNYSETLLDRDDDNPPNLYVFGKRICEQMVYIKLKIREKEEKTIVCVSFHYAEYEMDFPYA